MATLITNIKNHFRKLGYEISITAHHDFHNHKREHAFQHIISWKKGNDAARLLLLCEYYFGEAEAKELGDVYVNHTDFKTRGHGITGICKKCGCTNRDACYDEETGSCWWVKEDLCSACAPPAQKNKAMAEIKELMQKPKELVEVLRGSRKHPGTADGKAAKEYKITATFKKRYFYKNGKIK